MQYSLHESPIGPLTVVARGGALAAVYMDVHRRAPGPELLGTRVDDAHPEASRQLTEYFEGHRTTFDLELAPIGTPFQQTVWDALRTIGYGETWSYGQLAARIGRPTASRAVGMANGRNPISIVVPCHRVIGTNGKLTGYAGGAERKQYLLDLERSHLGAIPVA